MDSEPQITEAEIMKMSLEKQPDAPGEDLTVTPSQLIVDTEQKKKKKKRNKKKNKNKGAEAADDDPAEDGPEEGDDD